MKYQAVLKCNQDCMKFCEDYVKSGLDAKDWEIRVYATDGTPCVVLKFKGSFFNYLYRKITLRKYTPILRGWGNYRIDVTRTHKYDDEEKDKKRQEARSEELQQG